MENSATSSPNTPESNSDPIVTVVTPPSIESNPAPTVKEEKKKDDFEYAPIGKRALAIFIDGIALGTVGGVLGGISSFMAPGESTTFQGVASLISGLINIAYPLYFIGSKGQTLGKMAVGIKVIRLSDPEAKPGYLTAFLRETVGKIISAAVLFIGYLWAFKDPQKQTWHDKIAGTVVVKA